MTDRSWLHRVMGWRAPRRRRVLVVAAIATVVGFVTGLLDDPITGLLAGWDVAAALFITIWWQLILSADSAETRRVAMVEDESEQAVTAFVLGASLASLLAVAVTLRIAGEQDGVDKTVSIVGALLTVVLSWGVVNTVFTLRYADVHYELDAGVDFGDPPGALPDYRDFAYLAFTVGMCYQVSDTQLRDKRLRRTVLRHAVLSYVFGVVIVAAAINLVAGLLA